MMTYPAARRLIVPILCAVMLGMGLGALPARAQAPIRAAKMSVALWPEFDRPGVLVIYHGILAPDVPLPTTITFAVPAEAGAPSATAGVDESGLYHYRQYTTVVQGDQLLVSYSLPYREFQLEYYIDPLAGQGADKAFDFTYRADFPIDSFSFRVQEPSGATGMTTEPEQASVSEESGLPARVIPIGALEAGEEATVSVRYHREETRLSAEILGAPTPSPVQFEDAPQADAGGGISDTALIIGAVIIAAGLVGAAWIWTSSSGRGRQGGQAGRAPERTRHAKASAQSAARRTGEKGARPAEPSGTGRFCHQCGHALRESDKFCPQCGTPRR